MFGIFPTFSYFLFNIQIFKLSYSEITDRLVVMINIYGQPRRCFLKHLNTFPENSTLTKYTTNKIQLMQCTKQKRMKLQSVFYLENMFGISLSTVKYFLRRKYSHSGVSFPLISSTCISKIIKRYPGRTFD